MTDTDDRHTDKDSKKPQVTYCKIENLEALKTLLRKHGSSLSASKAEICKLGQASTTKIHDHKLKDPSRMQSNTCGRSLVRQDISLPR